MANDNYNSSPFTKQYTLIQKIKELQDHVKTIYDNEEEFNNRITELESKSINFIVLEHVDLSGSNDITLDFSSENYGKASGIKNCKLFIVCSYGPSEYGARKVIFELSKCKQDLELNQISFSASEFDITFDNKFVDAISAVATLSLQKIKIKFARINLSNLMINSLEVNGNAIIDNDLDVNGNATIGNDLDVNGNLTTKTIKQSKANWVLGNELQYLSTNAGVTVEDVYTRIEVINNILYIVSCVKIKNITESAIAYPIIYADITLPENIAEKILDLHGLSAKESNNAGISAWSNIRSSDENIGNTQAWISTLINRASPNVVRLNHRDIVNIPANTTYYIVSRSYLTLI